jgi:5-methyltetrahydropteroyltriglutamate--homocysteine methyltransferase
VTGIPRAEVVGSLLRPQYLKDARARRQAGDLTVPDFKRLEDRAVDDAIALQEEAGLQVVSDGEMRREVFMDSIAGAVDGITRTRSTGQVTRWHGEEDDEAVDEYRIGVTAKLELRRSIATEEFVYARSRATRPVKVTLPSPGTLALLWHPDYTPQVYADPFAFFEDLARIVRQEVQTLAALGCTYIQIDAPDLTKHFDEEGHEFFRSVGVEPDRMLTESIELLNSIPDGVSGVTFGLHLCRGNKRGRWRTAGGYEIISKALFKRATAYDTFLLEYDDARSGTFEALSDLPDDKVAVLGLVTTKRAKLESAEALVARIEDASRYFPKEQLAISSQCGFASEIGGNPLTAEEQRAKLHLVAEVAERVWG